MLGREDPQRSLFGAHLSVEPLLEPESFYDVLYREADRLITDDDFADCYDTATGRPSVPPSRMAKLVLLQAYEDLSDRQALERMAFDLRWKAVLGMEVGEAPVGQATLVDFRARLQLHDKMREVFERFVALALEAGLIAPETVQLIDSTAIWGRGAVEDTYNLIGSAVRRLLGRTAKRRGREPAEIAAEVGLQLTDPAGEGSLKGRVQIDWSEPEERQRVLTRVVEEARRLLAATRADEDADPAVAEAATLLRRILVQDLEPAAAPDAAPSGPDATEGPDGSGGAPDRAAATDGEATDGEAESEASEPVLRAGTPVRIRHGVARDRIVSAGDPEMRRGHKSMRRSWDGYKAHVSAEAEYGLVTAVAVTPANVHDGDAAPALFRAQHAAGLRPDANVGDGAYSAADLRVEAREMGTEIVARVAKATAPGGRFSKDRFTIDLEAECVTCPAGEVTRRSRVRTRKGRRHREYQFDGAVCAACALREACTSREPERMRRTGRGRSVTVHALEHVLEEARAAEQTPEVQALLALRPLVERTIGHLMGRGLRQARYKGTVKVRFQALASALAANLRRLGTLFEADPTLRARWRGAAGPSVVPPPMPLAA